MELLDQCFVQEPLREAVKFIDTLFEGTQQTNSFSNLEDLSTFIESDGNSYQCRCISICQRNSWQRLQIHRSMMDLIVQSHNIGPSFWGIPSCFYGRTQKLEEGFCLPYTVHRDGPWTEISYTVRYPEVKEDEDGPEWSIRQTGIFHRFNSETQQNVIILVNPVPNSKLQTLAENIMKDCDANVERNLFWLHEALFSCHISTWRQYIRLQEEQFLPIANTTFSTYIDEPLRVGYDSLSAVVSLETRLLQINSLLASSSDLLNDIVTSFTEELKDSTSIKNIESFSRNLKGYRRQCLGYAKTANYLQQRTEIAAQLLANALSFRDQVISNEQNANMLQLNKSAVFITTVTLVYVPASFVASFFGMNFFAMDQDNSRIVGTAMIWIYVVSTIALTLVSVAFYYWLVQHDGLLFKRLAPKVLIGDLRNLKFNIKRKGTATSDIRHLAV